MPGAIPARHLVIEIADFHNKIGHKRKWTGINNGSVRSEPEHATARWANPPYRPIIKLNRRWSKFTATRFL
jgi:hypothetical protein